MKKRVALVVLLLVGVMMVSTVMCSSAAIATVDTSEAERGALRFKRRGNYNLSSFNELLLYRFDTADTDKVMYQLGYDGTYLLGEDTIETGTSYANIYMKDSQFLALSEKYLLLLTQEGKIAVSIEEKKNLKIGEYQYEKYSFDELTAEEKADFRYPISYEKVTQ